MKVYRCDKCGKESDKESDLYPKCPVGKDKFGDLCAVCEQECSNVVVSFKPEYKALKERHIKETIEISNRQTEAVYNWYST